ncbi:hypothetical protein P7K49_009006 [Saguinus oedipus]|uniref:Uncharacterized protein n=1 Tax=Saguinus oedipus TaxID=9490 RepID=A0ABQ9VZB1_SAGOE|nr:hypothetical protein P7K49_009006 [Saguinus oedipus]
MAGEGPVTIAWQCPQEGGAIEATETNLERSLLQGCSGQSPVPRGPCTAAGADPGDHMMASEHRDVLVLLPSQEQLRLAVGGYCSVFKQTPTSTFAAESPPGLMFPPGNEKLELSR